ncbi:MAG: hypothetical protein C0613_08635 [Desulfobulbaceae bacterium]|nr:MAG: hypothetical protein C0613_08635 [Desulfobulbaceae bacterium]
MATIISIAGHQGGAGKSSTTMNLGISLARRGHRVLLVDTDPLGAVAAAAGLPAGTQAGLVQIMKGCAPNQAIIESSLALPLALLGNGVKQPTDAFFLEQQARKGGLLPLIRSLAEDYDYVLLDTPSGIEAMSAMAFAASHTLLLVLPCHANAVRTLPGLLRLMVRVRKKLNPELHLLGILASHFDKQNPYEIDTLAAMRTTFTQGLFFSTIMPRSHQFERAAAHASAIQLLGQTREMNHLYDQLAEEVINRLTAGQSAGNNHAQPERLF